jgi:hypothetical protein
MNRGVISLLGRLMAGLDDRTIATSALHDFVTNKTDHGVFDRPFNVFVDPRRDLVDVITESLGPVTRDNLHPCYKNGTYSQGFVPQHDKPYTVNLKLARFLRGSNDEGETGEESVPRFAKGVEGWLPADVLEMYYFLGRFPEIVADLDWVVCVRESCAFKDSSRVVYVPAMQITDGEDKNRKAHLAPWGYRAGKNYAALLMDPASVVFVGM